MQDGFNQGPKYFWKKSLHKLEKHVADYLLISGMSHRIWEFGIMWITAANLICSKLTFLPETIAKNFRDLL